MATLLKALSIDTNSTALIIPGKICPIILSHRELLQQVLRFQRKLANIGIRPQDAVAIAFPNTIEFAIAFLATTFQRATSAPLNAAYKQEEFEFYLEDLTASVILLPKGAVEENGEAVRAARNRGTAIAEIYWDELEIVLEMKDLGNLRNKRPTTVETPVEDDVALILHTSGTTGRPKAVCIAKQNSLLMTDTMQVPLTHKNLCQTMKNIKDTYKLTSEDRTMLVMPLFHVHGLLAGFLSPLASGGSLIMPPKFSGSEFWRDFVTFKANWYTAVPTMHQILLRNPMPSQMPVIRFVRSCSSPLAPTVLQQLETLLKAPVLEAYAMTEAAHQMTSNPLPPSVHKPGSVGVPQGLDLRIMDDAGNSLQQGTIGEVCVLGANVTSGYLGDPRIIASPFTSDGYLRTGDQGYLDAEGYLFLTGRIKELINKGGEKISPIEIDNLLAQHPKVLEAVSFAIDDDLYGQNVAVAIALKAGCQLSTDELLEWFGERAAKFKIPKKVRILTLQYLTPLIKNRCISHQTCPRPPLVRSSDDWWPRR
jgi:acyl-CoA synthetase (AMP-forming)/AMP-acid ligase II